MGSQFVSSEIGLQYELNYGKRNLLQKLTSDPRRHGNVHVSEGTQQ